MRYSLPLIAILATFVATFLSSSEATDFPIALNSNATTDTASDRRPTLASDGNGNWVAAWESADGGDLDILFAHSSDDGATWTAPALLNTTGGSDSEEDSDIQIAADGAGNWIAVWEATDEGTEKDILTARSSDDGASWSAPAVLNSNAAGDFRDEDPTIATDGAGNWIVAWSSPDDLGAPYFDFEILTSRSTDNGATWTPVALLNSDAASEPPQVDCCDDRDPQVAFGNGVFMTTWRKSPIGHGEDIFLARSLDGGATWTNVSNATNTSSVPREPQVATDGNGNWVLVWRSQEIRVMSSADDGASWTAPAVVNSNANDDIAVDEAPVVATDGSGTWVVAWESDSKLDGTVGADDDILIARSTDEGATWTDAQHLYADALTDSFPDRAPAIANGGNGWLTAWHSSREGDWDIFYVRCLPGDYGWTVALGDTDCDGWASSAEAVLGTDPGNPCGYTAGGETASENWPPDLSESNSINISDVLTLKPVFGENSPRHDLAASGGSINISDVLALKPVFGLSCTP